MTRIVRRLAAGAFLGFLFLLPFFGWIAAEPAPYRDPEGFFTITLPDGWTADDSGYMGKGVVMKGPAGDDGIEPVVHLTHEATGIVTLDERWYAHLGRLRYDLSRVNILAMENHEESSPPYFQAVYTWVDGDVTRKALARITRLGERFFLVTASAPESRFEALQPLFGGVIGSLRPGGE